MAKATRTSHWIGIDLGGTKMLAVLYDGSLKPIARIRKRTKGHEGAEAGVGRMVAMIEALLGEVNVPASKLGGIGIGCPGPLDLDRGIVLEMPNLGWKNVRIDKAINRALGCDAVLVNDVDAGVFAEYRFGAAKGARCVLGVFPGTGIGGGAVYRGEIIRGTRGSCMEIGHIPVMQDGPLCGCGRRGCLEAVTGRLAISAMAAAAAYRGDAPYILARAGTDLREIRSGVLADAIREGDTTVELIVRNAARTIGRTIAGVINLLAPDIILLGGGLVEDMPDLFVQEVEAAARERVMPSFSDTFDVVAAKLAGDATVLGAAAWVQRVLSGKSEQAER
ncbi:MAG: ROK family protein [Hyphomicrobiales bacterium]|nr:ROK family protein [Hyphomicrobiales bacterium]